MAKQVETEEKVFTDYVRAAIAQGKLVSLMVTFAEVWPHSNVTTENVDDLKQAAKQCGIKLPDPKAPAHVHHLRTLRKGGFNRFECLDCGKRLQVQKGEIVATTQAEVNEYLAKKRAEYVKEATDRLRGAKKDG